MLSIMFPQIASIFYVLVTLMVFIKKEKAKTIENTLFGILIISIFIELMLDLIFFYVVHYVSGTGMLSVFVSKVVTCFMIFWASIFTLYAYVISKEVTFEDRINNMDRWYKYANFKKRFIIAGVFVYSAVLLLPSEMLHERGMYYISSTSYSNMVAYLVSTLFIFLCIVFMASYKGGKFERKFFAVYAFLFLSFVEVIVQYLNPGVGIISPVNSFITVLIYFTMEDPNIKLLEYERTERERANKISESKSRFLENMSSELRTPLESIVGLSEDLETYMDNTPAEVQEDIKDINSASRTLMEIVGSIMDISKIEGGKLEIIPSDYAPKEEFKTLAKIMRTKVAEKPLKFNVDIAENIPDVLYGDRIRIKQIINNLLSNAIKYTEKGEVDFSVEWYLASNSLFIKVSDTGRGVKPEDIDRLFAKYDRLSVEKISSVQGTGLGLSITKELIEKMGGKVEVESVYGAGTTFKVTIPQQIGNKAAYEEKMRQKEEKHVHVDLSGKKILIVDDNLLNIKTLKKTLKKCNLIIEECYNGKEAIDKININQYDLVLMDLSMPVMTGEEAIRVLRSYSDFVTPIIAISANAVSDIEQKVIEMGFDDYLIKPYVKEQIIEKIEYMIKD